MKRKIKRIVTLLLTLCMLFGISGLQAPAHATEVEQFEGIAIEKVLTTISKTPVLLMPVVEIIANTSSDGCYVSSMSWTDSTGAAVGESFQDSNANTVTLRVDAAQGYFFAENVAAYLNNNQCDVVRDPSGSFITITRSYVPDVWVPSIAKHPGAETVELGGWASFVATATYCNKYEWSLVSPDGKTTVKIADVPSKFPGVTTDPDGSTKMNIYNIPAEMDGWKIRCTFSGPGGSVVSNGAKISIKGLPEPTPTPTPTPEPTPEPTAEPEEDEDGPGGGDTAHQHEYSAQYEYDGAYHWKQCDCGEITKKEAHDMQWTETKAPTKRADGEEQGRCTVCGYTDSRTLSYSDSKNDGDMDGGKLIKIILAVLIGLVVLTVILLIVDRIQRERRRRRRRRRRH